MEKKTLNLTEVAKYIGVDKSTLYEMIKDGRFPVLSIKGLYPRRWNVEDLDAWRLKK